MGAGTRISLLVLSLGALLLALGLLLSAAKADEEGAAPEEEGSLLPPVIVEPAIGEQHLRHMERNAAGTWFALLQPGSDVSDLVQDSRLLQIPGQVEAQEEDRFGFRVQGLPRNHPLYQMGLRGGDLLLELNGQSFTQPAVLARHFQAQPRPDSFELVYLRDDTQMTLTCHFFYSPSLERDREIRLREPRHLAELARQHYGHEHFARLIRRANGLAEEPQALPAGTWLTLPYHPALRLHAVQTEPGRWIVPESRWGEAWRTPLATLRAHAPEPTRLENGERAVRLGGKPTAPLYRWGLMPGDVLVRVNGHRVDGPLALARLLGELAEFRFFEVERLSKDVEAQRARETVLLCVLPEPALDPALLEPPPVTASPEQFGCERDAQRAERLEGSPLAELGLEGYGEATVGAAVAWRITRAQGIFFAHHVRDILHEAQARPALERDPETGEPRGYFGLEFARVESDTLLYAYGLRTGDVLRYVGVARTEQDAADDAAADADADADEPAASAEIDSFAPVRSRFELLEQFPLGASWEHALLLLERPGTGWVAAHLEPVPTPEEIEVPNLDPAAGLPSVAGYEPSLPEATEQDTAPEATHPPPGELQRLPPEVQELLEEMDPRDVDPELLRQLLERAMEEAEGNR